MTLTTPLIRPAATVERDAVAALVARAFADEPFTRWVTAGRPARLRRFAHLAVHEIAASHGGVLVDADLTTAALVLPPGAVSPPPREALRTLPALARATGLPRLPLVLAGFARLERAHPPESHSTLIMLAVTPERRGEGRAGGDARRASAPLLPRDLQPGGPAPLRAPRLRGARHARAARARRPAGLEHGARLSQRALGQPREPGGARGEVHQEEATSSAIHAPNGCSAPGPAPTQTIRVPGSTAQ